MAAETMTRDDIWRQIERDAREQGRAELDAIEATPLEYGAHVAWTKCHNGKTDELSPVHRVANTEKMETFCDETIPAPVRRLTLTSGWIKTQDRCRWCEQRYAQAAREQGAA